MDKQQIRFFYNGLKVNLGKLQKATVYLNSETKEIIISKQDNVSFSSEIQENFIVKNVSDTSTGYSAYEQFIIEPDNVYYREALNAVIQKTKKEIKIAEKKLAKSGVDFLKERLLGYQNYLKELYKILSIL